MHYFLGIEVARSRNGIVLSLRKYVQDLLIEIGMLGSKQMDILMDSNSSLNDTTSEYFSDKRRYMSLVGTTLL